MKKYNIKVDYIPGLPQDNFRKGRGEYEGVVSHCTDSGNGDGSDTPTAERNYEVKNWQHAFVHFFVGVENNKAVILQVAKTNYIAYGAGGKANSRFIHVELCNYKDKETFNMAYDAYCYLLAKLLLDRKLGVKAASSNGTGTLWSHKNVADYLGGTTHQDPIDYFKRHGISWDEHVANVKKYYDYLKNPEPTPKPISSGLQDIGVAKVTADTLNIRDGASTSNKIVGHLNKNEKVKVYYYSNEFWNIGKGKFTSAKYCTVAHDKAMVDVDQLNVRSGPGPNYSVKRIVKQGTVVTIHNQNKEGTWIQIGNNEWVKAEFLKR